MRTHNRSFRTLTFKCFCVCLLLQIATFGGLNDQLAFAQEATVPNTEIVLSIHADGSAPFSGVDAVMSHSAGCLDSPHPIPHTAGADGDGDGANSTCPASANGILRTFDTVTYRVDWNVNELDATGITTTFTLPAAMPEAQWAAIPDGCDPAGSAISNNEQTLTCLIGDHEEGTFGTIFPIAEIDGTNSTIDGRVLALSGEIDSNEGVAGTSNEVELTISAAAVYDWRKGKATMYRDVVKTGTGGDPDVTGYVIVWPIMLKPGGGNSRGLAPLNDSVPIQFYDHFFYMSSNLDSSLEGELITPGTLGNYTNYPLARVCGGYDGAGDEEFWDYTDQVFDKESLPYGVAGLGNADNTTLGAQGSESIICSDATTGSYPITQIDITNHNTSNAAPKSAAGSGSNGSVITAQIALWVPETEIYPGSVGNSFVHNIISGTTTPLDPVNADEIDFPSEQGDPIVVAGSASGFETDATNNGPHTSLLRTPTSPGPMAYRHYVLMHRGPYKEMQHFDPNHGLPFASIDTRNILAGGLGQNGLYDYDGSVSINLGTNDVPWGFDGEVSRNQVITVEMKVATAHTEAYPTAHREEIHGCLYIDNEYMDIVDFPTNFDITETTSMYEHVQGTVVGSLGTGNASHGLVHVLYGDHARSTSRSWAVSEPVRLNPAFTPDYVVEVAKAVTDVGIDYERGEINCDDDQADGGWTAIETSTDLSAFDSDGDGRYEGIEMIRLRTLEPTPWAAPFPSEWNNYNDAGSVALSRYGTTFNMYVQAQVKSAVADAPTGQKIYVHAARARGPYNGVDQPLVQECTRYSDTDPNYASFELPDSGWCNLASLPEVGEPGQADPIEQIQSTADYPVQSHRDTVTIVGPRLGFSKKNANGSTDIVQNGDLVTFNMAVSVTGSPTPTDMVRDIRVVDTLISNYEYVSHVDPADGTCNISGQTLTCDFGDRIAPWSNTFSVTVRVTGAGPEKALGNTGTASGVYGTDDFPVESKSVAYAYTPGPYHQVKINKEVPDLEGPCVHAPGEPYYGPDSDDCSWTDRDDTLHYELEYANTGFKDLANFRIIDVLPHPADEDEIATIHLGTPAGSPGDFGDGRWPNSDYAIASTLELVSVTPSDTGATVYYTNAAASSVNRDPDDPSNATGFPNGSTTWCSAFGGTGCPADISEATAFYVDLGTLSIAGTGTIDIVMQTADNVEDDIYTNTFGARTDDILVPGRSNDVSIMIEEYDLALIKRLKAGQSAGVINGSQVVFEIIAKNQGTVDSDEYSITDQIPAGMSFVSANPSPDGSPVGGLLTWTFTEPDTLAAGDTQLIELVLQVDNIGLAGFRNWAEIESDAHDDSDSTPGSNDGNDLGAGDGGTAGDNVINHNDIDHDATSQDPNDEDDSDYEDLFPANYDLALVKRITAATPTPVAAGTQVTFSIDVMNQGNVPSGSYTVDDMIPAGMSFVSASPSATNDPGVGNTGTVQWVVPTGSELAVGAQTTFTLVVQVDDTSLAPFRNTAEISADSGAPFGGDSDSDPTDGSGLTDDWDDNDVTNDNDPGDSDDSDFAVLPAGGYDLALIKSLTDINPTPAALGSEVTFEITVMNQGGIPSGTYTVTDALPPGMGYVSSTPAATTNPGLATSGAVEWVVPVGNELAPGESTTFEVVVSIIDDTLGPYRNEAEITADSGDDEDSDPTDGSGSSDTFNDSDVNNDQDPGDSDDSDFEELSLTPEYDLSLIKQTLVVDPTPVANGTEVTYRISVMNQGNVPSDTFTVTDSIPTGMNFVSASPVTATNPGVGSNGDVTWVVAAADELQPGQTATFDLVVVIADETQSPFRNEAEITADSGAPFGGDSDSDPTDGSGSSDTFNDDDESNDNDPGDSDDSDFEELTAGGYDLALIKEFVSMSPSPAGLGTQIVFDITVMNQGGVPSGAFSFNDALPSPLGYIQAVPAPTTHPGIGNTGTLTWSFAAGSELAPGQQLTVRVTTVVMDISLGGDFRNESEITEDSGDDEDSDPTDGSGASDTFDDHDVTNDQDPSDSDDSDWAPFQIPPVYDLALIKDITAVAPTPAAAGSQVTYTITVMNQGNMPSGTYTVDDVLPAGMTFVSASPAATTDPGIGGNGPVQWVVPAANEIAPAAQTTFTLVVEIADPGLAPFRNTAEISADSGAPFGGDEDSDPGDGSGITDTFDDPDVTNDNDPGDSDDSDFAVLPLGGYDLALIKEILNVDPTPPALGSNVTFRVTVMNQGGLPSGSYTVEDVLPAGMAFVSASPAATSDPGVGVNGTVQWLVPAANELAPGATTTFDVVAELIDDTLAPYRNNADITADSGEDEDSTPGDGSGAADTFDDSDVSNDQDPGDADDSDFAEFSLTPEYDLSLIKQTINVAPTPVANGTQATYRMTVMNQGNVASGTFTVTDAIPAGMTFVSATPAASSDPGVGSTGNVTWIIPVADELAPGESMTLDLVVEVDDDGLAPFRNESEISADSGAPYGGDSDSDPTDGSAGTDTFNDNDASNDSDPDDSDDSDYEILGAGGYDLSLVKDFISMSPDPAALGSVLTFSVTVVNQGGVPSGAFSFDDTLPSPLGYVQAVPAPTSHPGIGNTGILSWSVPVSDELQPGQQMTVVITTEIIDVTLGGPFRNEAGITADSSGPHGGDEDSVAGDGSAGADTFDDFDPYNDNDPGDADDSDFAGFVIPPRYDLSLEKALDPQQPLWVVRGQTVNYDIVVTNDGNLPSGTFSIVDTVPAGLSFASATGPGFVCTPDAPSAGKVQCDYTPPTATDLVPLQSVQLDLAMTVDDLAQAPFTNHVEITEDSAGDYGLTDDDSTPNSNTAAGDTGPGEGTPGETQDDASSAILRAASSTPVTLKMFRSRIDSGLLTVDWITSMEDGNQGFLIYGRIGDGRWIPINKSIIPTQAVDDEGTTYRHELPTSRRFTELTLTDVDLFGSEVVHGPFKIGQRYGDFDSNGNVTTRRMNADGDADEVHDLFSKPNYYAEREIYIDIVREGVHRVTYEEMLEAGVDFNSVAAEDIALTHLGKAIPIRVKARGPDKAAFGRGSWVEFIAEPIDSLYVNANTYRLSVNPEKAERIRVKRESDFSPNVKKSSTHVYKWAPERQYSRVAPGADPWYALKLSAINEPLKKTLKFALNDLDVTADASIELDLWSVADNPALRGDHHLRVWVNNQLVGNRVFDGVAEASLVAPLQPGTLVAGVNEITLELPLNRGSRVDTIIVDAIRILHGRRLLAGRRQLIVSADGVDSYRIGGFPNRNISVYRVDDDGTTSRIKAPLTRIKSGFSLRFGEQSQPARYYVAHPANRLTPTLRQVPIFNPIQGGDAEYVVISHRRFINNDLRRLVNARQAEGLTTRIVDVDRLYAGYSGGMVDPAAIKQFIIDAHDKLGTKTVVLVGGDSYDYKKNLQRNARQSNQFATSYIPSIYASTGQAVQHAPVDPLYGDIDNDGVPDIAVGRLPVQSRAELRTLIDKILNYAVVTTDQNAVFVSDGVDDGTRRSFSSMSQTVRSRLRGWKVGMLSRDDIDPLRLRRRFRSLVESGQAMTVYFGHSDANDWGFDGLVRRSDVRQLTNTANPTAVMQFGCWNTYYVAPRANTLAHHWLVEGSHGAAIVMGATTLTEAGSEQDFAGLIMDGLSAGKSYGDAVIAAKVGMVEKYGLESVKDLVNGFVILGDPAMKPPAR